MNLRRLGTFVGLAALLALLAGQVHALLRDPSIWPPDDFVEYWAAARLTIEGQNPYDPALLLPLQQEAGRDTKEAVMMWNPPWSLAVVLPLGLLPARLAQLLWLLVNLAAVGYSGDRLWRTYGGSPERRWLGWLVAGAFVPTLFALHAGQIGPIALLGAVLFLVALQCGRPALAGAATVLLAVKPHLAYLVWLAILCDAVARWRFRVVLGGCAAGGVALLLPLLFNPALLHQYADAMGNRPPDQWLSPTLGTVLRLTYSPETFRLQFIPVLFGLAWFAWYWRAQEPRWDWMAQTPLLLLVCFVTAPYGAWPFDLVLLLPTVIQLTTNVRLATAPESSRWVLAVLIGIDLGCLGLNLFQSGSFWFLWVAPALLLLHAAVLQPVEARARAIPEAAPS